MSHNEAVKFTAIECYKKCLWTSKILRWIYGIKKKSIMGYSAQKHVLSLSNKVEGRFWSHTVHLF